MITTHSTLDASLAKQYPLRILVAEDHPVNQKLAQALLEKMGYLADIAGNGLEALTALEARPYDLVFMDVQMPEMDGLEATQEIVKRWPEDKRPIVIAMTAYASQGDKASCLRVGMNDFIRKPILKDELQRVLIKWAKHINHIPEDGGETQMEQALLPSDEKLIDESLLLERVDQDEELFHDLIQLFIVECPKLLESIRQTILQRHYEALHPLAHTLKGMCQNVCIPSMQEVAYQMELSTRDVEDALTESQLSEWIVALETDYESIRSQYRS